MKKPLSKWAHDERKSIYKPVVLHCIVKAGSWSHKVYSGPFATAIFHSSRTEEVEYIMICCKTSSTKWLMQIKWIKNKVWQRRTYASEEYLYHIILKPASQNIKNQQGINRLMKMLMQPIRTCKQVNLVGLAHKRCLSLASPTGYNNQAILTMVYKDCNVCITSTIS